MRPRILCTAFAWTILWSVLGCAAEATGPKKRPPDASDELFGKGLVPRLKLQIAAPEMEKLRQNPRSYVKATVVELDGKTYKEVGVKLKGAAGSFRGVDDRPALTLNFDKYERGQRFHALDKLHLNNSVQDPTYLHELMSAEICAAAGVPTARATHARVWLNDRDLGFYGLKEGFDRTFLKRHFENADGNLYDGGFCTDIDSQLEKDCGEGPDDRSDLQALVAACREPDPALRWQRLGERLEVDAFLRFMAVELMMCHWDGYCNNRNNYRVYFDPLTKKANFFPHGMDQMFGDTNAAVLHTPGAMVASAVLGNPEWKAQYRERLNELIAIFNPPDKLHARIDEAVARMRPTLTEMNPGLARDIESHAKGLKDRLVARAQNLVRQASMEVPKPLSFDANGIAPVTKWYTKSETEDARHDEVSIGGAKAYSITAGPSGRCVASWRSTVLLAAGKYEFEARVRTLNVVAVRDPSGAGAGVRVSGGQRTNQTDGTTDWKVVRFPLEIANPTQEVELVAELRATRGQVWFDAASLRLLAKR